MAKHKVVHSEDACTVVIKGDPRSPEPSTAIIKFPGGYVEVSRTSDGTYWAHVQVSNGRDGSQAGELVSSRIDYSHPFGNKNGTPAVPDAEHIDHIAVRVKRAGS